MNKHTPGPWTYTDGNMTPVGPQYIIRGRGAAVAEVFAQRHTAAENARLIAAAPDLLAALRALANTADNADGNFAEYRHALRFSVQQARAAIARAEGKA